MLTVARIVSMGVGTPVNMRGYMHVPMYCMIVFTHKKGNMHIITYINVADRCLAKQPKYTFPFTKQKENDVLKCVMRITCKRAFLY